MDADKLLAQHLIRYYDKGGKPIQMMEWAKLLMDADYKRIAVDQVGDFLISTIWSGIDHGQAWHILDNQRPLIFETMIFRGREGDMNWKDIFCERYSTEEEARTGHRDAVERVKLGRY